MDDDTVPSLLPWTTPRLEMLGTMDDVRNGNPGGDVDDDFLSNVDPIS